MKISRPALAVAAAALIAGVSTVASAETKLKSITSLPSNLELAKSYLENFRAEVNKNHKGVIDIQYVGGPEVVPPDKAGDALRRGQFDILHSPTAYYIGLVPEGYALQLATKSPAEIRENGGWELLEKVWEQKANAKLLGWGEWGTQYNTYLAKKPSFTPEGNLSLSEFKMRVTGTYRPLFVALGATGVGIKATEIYTAIQRGVVQGFGWPDVGIIALGLKDVVKYRIDPPFYRSNNVVTVNLDAWNKLPANVQGLLQKAGAEYEQKSIAYMKAFRDTDQSALEKAGMEIIKLEGSAAKHYTDAANVAIWSRMKDQSDIEDQLQEKLFPDWTPPKS
ncbi:MAG: TRAP transporter substrate-binding protein DctP [Proteobacteria bacterium]|nr:TRAP transporter substrate-binding protein DctP [Pseudomonadota bacterium]